MRLAFSTLACPGWPLERVVDAVARYGYEGVELRLLGNDMIGPDLPVKERERVSAAFTAAGVPIIAVDSSVRLVEGKPGEIIELIELARSWDCPILRVFGGELATDPETRSSQLAVASSVLTEAVSAAEHLGVHIAVETHDAFSDALLLAELLATVPAEWVGAVWDIHHPHRMGQDPATVLGALADRLVMVQVKDARRNPARRSGWDLVALGEGEVPVRAALRLLLDAGYSGWLSVEWEKKWHPEIASADIALPQHSQVLRQWLNAA